MKIASNYELFNKTDLLTNKIKKGEKVAVWSVETESNNYSDDLFNGTLAQCRAYANRLKKHYKGKIQIALIELDERLCVTYYHDIVHVQ